MDKTFPVGARVYVDGRDEAVIAQVFPEGSTSLMAPHYCVRFKGGGGAQVKVSMKRVGVDLKKEPKVTKPKSKIQLTKEEELDNLTRAVTSYTDFEALVTACKAGYTPTLLPVGPHGKQNSRLADALVDRRFHVWRVMNTV